MGKIGKVTAPGLLYGYSHSSLKISRQINSWIGQGAIAKPKIKQKIAEPTARRREISLEARENTKMLPIAPTSRIKKVGSIVIL